MNGNDQCNAMIRSAVLVAALAAAGLAIQPATGQSAGGPSTGAAATAGPATNSPVVIRHQNSASSSPIDSAENLTGPADTGVEPGVDSDSDAVSPDLTALDESASAVESPYSQDSTLVAPPLVDSTAIEAQPLGADSGILDLGSQNKTRDRDGLVAGLVEFSQVGGALAVVVGLLVFVAFMMKRMSGGFASGAGRPSGILQILARYPVARGQSLVLLKIDRHILLVHQSGSSMTTLTELTDPNEVASILAKVEQSERNSIGGSFHRMLNKAGDSYRNSRTKIETIDLTRPDQARRFKTSAQGTHIAS